MVERSDQARPVFATVVGAKRIGKGLEAAAIVMLEHPGGKVRRGAILESVRNVADAQPGARAARRAPDARAVRNAGRHFFRMMARDPEPQSLRQRDQQRKEWIDRIEDGCIVTF